MGNNWTTNFKGNANVRFERVSNHGERKKSRNRLESLDIYNVSYTSRDSTEEAPEEGVR